MSRLQDQREPNSNCPEKLTTFFQTKAPRMSNLHKITLETRRDSNVNKIKILVDETFL